MTTGSDYHPTGERLAMFGIDAGCLRLAGIPLRLALTDPDEAEAMRNMCVSLAEAQDRIDEMLAARRARADVASFTPGEPGGSTRGEHDHDG